MTNTKYSESQSDPIKGGKSRTGTGFKAAQLGGAIGFRFGGQYGMIIGTICGFSAGILLDELLED